MEGGGDRAALKSQLRQGFRDLLVKAGFAGRLPRVVACGPRDRAFRNFGIALREGSGYPILLVDSESVVRRQHRPKRSSGAWEHLAASDNWIRPSQASDDQAQLMATCMETWLIADHRALQTVFSDLNPDRLLPLEGLEGRSKEETIRALERATSPSRRGSYAKGRDSFAVLGIVNPSQLEQWLPHFRRFIETMNTRLRPPSHHFPGRTGYPRG